MPLSSTGPKDFIRLADFSLRDLERFIDRAAELKRMQKSSREHFPLKGRTLGMIFEHSSTRTRAAFEVGMNQLGGQAIFLSSKDTQIGRGEPMADTARVLSRYVNAIAARLDSQADLAELARYASIPVVSGLTQEHHPCQILADLLTVYEVFGDFHRRRITYIGDSNNVSNSWIDAAVVAGFPLTLCCAKGYHPDFKRLLGHAKPPQNIRWETDPIEGVRGAEVVTTDVWVSMGTRGSAKKKKALARYQVNEKLLKHADPAHIVLHCLPAHRDEEITAGVMDGSHSQIFNQAENKLHAQKAILELCMT